MNRTILVSELIQESSKDKTQEMNMVVCHTFSSNFGTGDSKKAEYAKIDRIASQLDDAIRLFDKK